MRPGKIGSLSSVLVVGWLAACGSDFSGGEGDGGSGGGSGSAGKGAGGSQNKGGTGSAGKGGNTSGGSGATGGNVATAGETGSAGEGVINPGMAGAAAAGAPSTTSSCRTGALENVLFCDDFEDPSLPDWAHLQVVGDDGETVHVTEPVHTGSGAVRSTKTVQGSLDPLLTDELGLHTSDRMYARVWMYIPASVTISNDPLANASLLVLGESGASDGGISLVMWANNKVTMQIYRSECPRHVCTDRELHDGAAGRHLVLRAAELPDLRERFEQRVQLEYRQQRARQCRAPKDDRLAAVRAVPTPLARGQLHLPSASNRRHRLLRRRRRQHERHTLRVNAPTRGGDGTVANALIEEILA